ncbi:MAG: pyrroline-5-carboxylate reductase [Lachnospiraceae bacterium]|nr:pyrroline-5-carboxylate reductase [Lachnospiraceae bacterium]
MKIGFIGLGNMASAMIGAIIKKELFTPGDILGADVFPAANRKAEESFGLTVAADNKEVVKEADILVLSVKPQFYADVIAEIRDLVDDSKIVITIAPGKTLSWLTEQFGKEVKLVRCMPNTPALVLEGCTGVCPSKNISDEEMKLVMEILGSFGRASVVPERLMDVVVGVSGSSPAYVFLFIEAMADAAVAEGMPRAQAYEFAAQAVYGSAKMVLELGKHPGELKDMVCSPGGTTIQAVKVLEEKGMRAAVIDATVACIEKSRSM